MLTKARLMTTIFGLALLLIAGPVFGVEEKTELSAAQPAGQETDGPPGCKLAGTWYEVKDDGQIWLTTAVNAGPGHYVMVGESLFDPGYGGWFPDAVAITNYRGDLYRIGPTTYSTTHLAFAVDAEFNIVYIALSTGTSEVIDCDTMETNFNWAVYGPDQDPFGEEAPMHGCFNLIGVTHRMPMAVPCEP